MKSLESSTPEKWEAFYQVFAGTRKEDFRGFLPEIPDATVLQELLEACNIKGNPKDIGLGFDIDGTLSAPYCPIPAEIIEKLQSLKDAGYNIAFLSNNPSSLRQQEAEKLQIPLCIPKVPKPHPDAFLTLSKFLGVEVNRLLFFGDTPATDAPLRPRNLSAWEKIKPVAKTPYYALKGGKLPEKALLTPHHQTPLIGGAFLVQPKPLAWESLPLKKAVRAAVFRLLIRAELGAMF